MPRADAAVAIAIAALAVVAALVGVLVIAALLARQRRMQASLHEAATRAATFAPLLDVWRWESDAEHRLVDLRPPRGASDAAWRHAARRGALLDVLRPADGAALQARMRAGDSLDDVAIAFMEGEGDGTGTGTGTAANPDVAAPRSAPAGGDLRLCGRAWRDGDGRLRGYVGTLTATAVVRASTPMATAASNVDAAAAAADAERALENESFSYTVSHDLRAPIRVVEGFTRIVKEDYGRVIDRIGHDHLDRVLGAAARMNSMIDALLALSRLSSQPLARVPVNLSQLAGFVVEELRRQAPERTVEVDIEPGLATVGDPTLLRLALENLLGNAWKYTGRPGTPARIAFGRHGDTASTFTVSDNGAGFDMRFADRLFGVFQRLHSASDFPGHGVGLASVRRIVRRHGGEIWAESEPEHGARFHFSLPQH